MRRLELTNVTEKMHPSREMHFFVLAKLSSPPTTLRVQSHLCSAPF